LPAMELGPSTRVPRALELVGAAPAEAAVQDA
jgi:hypothetical protein